MQASLLPLRPKPSSDAPLDKEARCYILELPVELRLKIFRHLVMELPLVAFNAIIGPACDDADGFEMIGRPMPDYRRTDDRKGDHLMSVMDVCRQFSSEFASVLFDATELVIALQIFNFPPAGLLQVLQRCGYRPVQRDDLLWRRILQARRWKLTIDGRSIKSSADDYNALLRALDFFIKIMNSEMGRPSCTTIEEIEFDRLRVEHDEARRSRLVTHLKALRATLPSAIAISDLGYPIPPKIHPL